MTDLCTYFKKQSTPRKCPTIRMYKTCIDKGFISLSETKKSFMRCFEKLINLTFELFLSVRLELLITLHSDIISLNMFTNSVKKCCFFFLLHNMWFLIGQMSSSVLLWYIERDWFNKINYIYVTCNSIEIIQLHFVWFLMIRLR